jgi:glucose/arabinose dehydrogenase
MRSLLALCAALSLTVPACATAGGLQPSFLAPDTSRPRLDVELIPLRFGRKMLVATQPVDLAFFPGDAAHLLVAEKKGVLRWFDLDKARTGAVLSVPDPGSDMEEGLVGFALHPRYPENGEIYTYHLATGGPGGRSVITRWAVRGDVERGFEVAASEVVLQFDQPSLGHNGGQVAFGPDGMLYVGFGDGGYQNDPGNRVQGKVSYFGTIIRIDVDRRDPGKAYAVPQDNPFIAGGHQPEVWAYGFRNPWRFAFAPDGRLLVADVGQDRIEEIDVVLRGGNYGWSLKEGTRCFGTARNREGRCDDETLIDPLYEYGRDDGRAVIGGKFWSHPDAPALQGSFLFGDNTNGRIWALRLPAADGAPPTVTALGGFGIGITAFGNGPKGGVYVAAFGGRIYQIAPKGFPRRFE